MSTVPRLPPREGGGRHAAMERIARGRMLKVEARDRPTEVVDFDALFIAIVCSGDSFARGRVRRATTVADVEAYAARAEG